MPWFDKHAKARARFSEFVDGTLVGPDLGKVNAHIEECERCAVELDQLLLMSEALGTLPEVTPRRSFALTPEMVAAPPGAVPPPPMPKLQLGMRLASAAIALALVVVFVADNGLGGSSDGERPSSDDSAASVESGADNQGAEGDLAPAAGENLEIAAETPLAVGGTGGGSAANGLPGSGGGIGGAPGAAEGVQGPDSEYAQPIAPEDSADRDGGTDGAIDVTDAPGTQPDADSPESDSGAGEEKATGADTQAAAADSDDGGVPAVLIAELMLLTALIGTVGASVFLAVRSRRS